MQGLISRMRTLAILAPALALAACGGHTGVTLGGKVSGLTTDGLVLANGNNTVAIPANATSYTFPGEIGNSDSYNIVVLSQPKGLTCTVAYPSATATGITIDWLNVSCSPNVHTVGGTISGLNTNGLVLTNGSDTVAPAAGATSFTFPTSVAENAVYGVAVLTQPTGQTCSVTNGTAVMGAADVTSVQVACQ